MYGHFRYTSSNVTTATITQIENYTNHSIFFSSFLRFFVQKHPCPTEIVWMEMKEINGNFKIHTHNTNTPTKAKATTTTPKQQQLSVYCWNTIFHSHTLVLMAERLRHYQLINSIYSFVSLLLYFSCCVFRFANVIFR